jgi:hypothetical protein
MIEMPRRSVTRFFIPLIDVLFLMFSMFLLLPFMQPGAKAGKDLKEYSREELEKLSKNLQKQLTDTQQVLAANKRAKEQAEQHAKDLRLEVERMKPYADTRLQLKTLKQELDALKTQKIEALQQRLWVRILNIDPKTGKLFYYEPSKGAKEQVIDSAQKAWALIAKDRARPDTKGREIYYLFVLPPVGGALGVGDWDNYQNWFRSVAHGVDMSLGGMGG